MAKRKAANICINIVSSLAHIELLEYNAGKGSFVHLDSEHFMFDPATRDLLDPEEELKSVIKRLYLRNKIPNKQPTTLVVPSFFTRQYSVPDDMMNMDLKPLLVAEAERFYVFKKIDPDVGYCSIKNNEVLYTAYPKQPLEAIKRVFQDLKIPLFSVDCNYTATIRGLVAMGVVQQEVSSQTKWGLVIISDFFVFMAVLEGRTIEKTLEAPLPLQNEDDEAILNEIQEDFNNFFGFEVLSRMVVINNSLKMSSPTMIDRLGFQGATDVFDQNSNTLATLGAKDAPFPCTLEAIGGALVNNLKEVPALDLSDDGVLEALVDQDRKNFISMVMIIVGVLIFAAQWGAGFVAESLEKGEKTKSQQLQSEITQKVNSFSIIPELKSRLYLKQAIFQNYRVSNLMVKVFKDLPQDAWLKEVTLTSLEDMKNVVLTVDGGIESSDTLNNYVKELNTEMDPTRTLTPSIQPAELEGTRFFTFSLNNKSASGGAI